MSASGSKSGSSGLTVDQVARIERNRQKALLLRQEKLKKLTTNELLNLEQPQSSRQQDSGGGFLIEDDSDEDDRLKDKYQAPDSPTDKVQCQECSSLFSSSFLRKRFEANICDQCKDLKEKHSLITRTEAKSEFMLKDCDLDLRQPPLRFILKKNPHHRARSDMRLYLRIQVEERSLEVHGSEDDLESKRKERSNKRSQRKQKEFDKKMKTLRMAVRSSLYAKERKYHQHEYGEEEYNSETEEYRKTCKTCANVITYEKM